uniref:Uncharacterized protein n=1 Tax=Mycena chlorophos TaxID=658473 RepID=A0ABQ0L0A6_MYCCL|nr:predicted protein [Mycena chlorophos]
MGKKKERCPYCSSLCGSVNRHIAQSPECASKRDADLVKDDRDVSMLEATFEAPAFDGGITKNVEALLRVVDFASSNQIATRMVVSHHGVVTGLSKATILAGPTTGPRPCGTATRRRPGGAYIAVLALGQGALGVCPGLPKRVPRGHSHPPNSHSTMSERCPHWPKRCNDLNKHYSKCPGLKQRRLDAVQRVNAHQTQLAEMQAAEEAREREEQAAMAAAAAMPDTVNIITVETPTEHRKRLAAKAKKAAKKSGSAAPSRIISEKPLPKTFNLETPKTHLMGYYPDSITRVGTLDSYSMQIGEALHRGPKQGYRRTNRKEVDAQLATAEHRARITRETVQRMEEEEERTKKAAPTAAESKRNARKALPLPEDDPLPPTPPRVHYQVGESKRTFFKYGQYPTLPDVPVELDPMYDGFSRNVKIHFRQRLTGEYNDDDFTSAQLNDLLIEGDRLYTHAFMHINFSTPDRQRDQDLINPRTRCNIMVAADPDGTDDNECPYLFGRVLHVFHAEVRLRSTGKRPERLVFVLVRWYQRDQSYKSGWKRKRLHRLEFIPHDEPGAFGFLDPGAIIRGVHLIPHFRYGRTNELLPRSVARQFDPEEDEEDADWAYYSLNWFVDRDMISRFLPSLFGPRLDILGDAGVPAAAEPVDPDPEAEKSDSDEQEDALEDLDSLVVDVQNTVDELLREAEEEEMGENSDGDEDDDEDFAPDDAGRRRDSDSEESDDESDHEEDQDAVELHGDEAALDHAGFDRF